MSEQAGESTPCMGECRNCGYLVVLVTDVGWLHDEVPRYDGHECNEAEYGPFRVDGESV